MICILRASHVAPDPRVEKIADALTSLGLQCEVLGWDRDQGPRDGLPQRINAGTVRVRRLRFAAAHGRGLANLVGLTVFQFYLAASLLARRPTAIHACDLSTGVVAVLVAKIFRIPVVYDVFDYYADAFPVPQRLKPVVIALETWVINRVDEVVITTEARQDQLRAAVPRSLTVVHNSPHISTIPQSDRECDVAYVGILAHGRLLVEVLDVFARNPAWKLKIAGFGPLAETVELASERCENIEYLGRLDYEEAMHVQASCRVMFATYDPSVPNHRFSSPNKFYEALGLGKPIVVVRETGVDRAVERHGMGRVIDYTGAAFEHAVRGLLADPEFLDECRQRGPRVFHEHYSWEIMRTRLISIYDRVGVAS